MTFAPFARWAKPAALVLAFGLAAGPAAAARQVEQVTSPGGIVAWLVREPAVPVISMRFAFQGGSAFDPAGQEGLAAMLADLMTEGAGDLDALAFQGRLEALQARFSVDAGDDSIGGSLSTLSEYRDQAFALAGLALGQPRFDEDALARVRGQMQTGLRQHQANPNWRARRTFEEAVFGEHPYGRAAEGTEASLAAIGREDLLRAARLRFTRDRLLIGVVGDIGAEELGPLLDRTFGQLPAASPLPELPPLPDWRPGLLKVVRMDFPQSSIVFGLPGMKRDDPDWYAAFLLNTALGGGGGLTSVLAEEVREKRGLAYSVYSYLMPRKLGGLWVGGAGTRNERAHETLQVLRDVLQRISIRGIDADELARAKTYVNGSFPLALTSSGRIAGLLVTMQENELGIDYMEKRQDLIDRVSVEDVKRVASRLLSPEKLSVVVAGAPEGIDGGG